MDQSGNPSGRDGRDNGRDQHVASIWASVDRGPAASLEDDIGARGGDDHAVTEADSATSCLDVSAVPHVLDDVPVAAMLRGRLGDVPDVLSLLGVHGPQVRTVLVGLVHAVRDRLRRVLMGASSGPPHRSRVVASRETERSAERGQRAERGHHPSIVPSLPARDRRNPPGGHRSSVASSSPWPIREAEHGARRRTLAWTAASSS